MALGAQPKKLSASSMGDDLEAKRQKILDCGAAPDAVRVCSLCKVTCVTQGVFDTHMAGRKHEAMVKKQQQASVASQDNNLGKQPKETSATPTKGLEAKRCKILDHGVVADAVKVCSLCNVICISQRMFDFHMAGRKHVAMVKQQQLQQASVGSQDKALGKQAAEQSAPPTEKGLDAKREQALDHGVVTNRVNVCSLCKVICISQTMFDIHMAGRKHAAMVKQQQQQQQQQASVGCQDKPLGEQPKEKSAPPTEDGLEAKRLKGLDHWVAADAVKVCSLCKVICNSQVMFDIHMAGRKHAAMVKQLPQQQAFVGGQDKPLGEQPKEKSAHPAEDGLVAKRQKVLDDGVAAVAVKACSLCKVICNSQTTLRIHVAGWKHAAMVKQQQQASVGGQDKPLGEQQKEKSAHPIEDGLEAKRQKVLDHGVAADAVKVCSLCKVICNSQTVLDIHMAGQKHAAKVKQQQQRASVGGQEKPLGEQPREKSACPTKGGLEAKRRKALDHGMAADADSFCKITCNSQRMLDIHRAGRKHMAMVEQQLEQTSIAIQDKSLGEQSKKESACPVEEDLEATRQMVLDSLVIADEVSVCSLCNVVCSSEKMFNIHMAGKKHAAMVKKQQQASVASQKTDLGKNLKRKFAPLREEDLEAKRRKALDSGVAADVIRICTLCKVICITDTVFHSHMGGQRHARKGKQQNQASVARQDKSVDSQTKNSAPPVAEEL